MEQTIPVLLVLIIVTCLFSWKGFNDPSFFNKYMFQVARVKAGEQYRMFTSALLHGDLMHLAFNMYTLYMFAPILVYYFGSIQFLIIYIFSVASGSLLAYAINKDNNYYSAIGASGGVMGIIYSAILINPDMGLYFFFIPIRIPAFVFAIGYLAYSVFGVKKAIGNIGHEAHIGGALGGIIITGVLNFGLILNNLLLLALLLLPIVILFVMHKNGKLR
ncbi:rhomboid family intramembrane serine protease [Flavobacterium agricola]|uniref:Rhomboid family intramembrane serine protease n=1 Tax=Flavobacterium agricola TaxID=2870839 RepID=A0ABY6M2C5_9FLAO|nr:rhomboid family intramembrane serine protease [Flavobacterium agricola]UYW01555.1 rhomboid family intramembrane serine protease [Flavobacterium agricola]